MTRFDAFATDDYTKKMLAPRNLDLRYHVCPRPFAESRARKKDQQAGPSRELKAQWDLTSVLSFSYFCLLEDNSKTHMKTPWNMFFLLS